MEHIGLKAMSPASHREGEGGQPSLLLKASMGMLLTGLKDLTLARPSQALVKQNDMTHG